MRSKGGCSGVRSAVSEPGRIPRSPTLRSMGNKAAHDTDTATEESGGERERERRKEEGGERRQSASSQLRTVDLHNTSRGNPTCKTKTVCKQKQRLGEKARPELQFTHITAT